MIYQHWRQVTWNETRWPNFSPQELACPYNGEFYFDPDAFDRIQALRSALGVPVIINSGHRSAYHNVAVGGAPLSLHRKIAFDVSLRGHDREDVLRNALRLGFTGIGFYQTFIHLDTRPYRARWHGGEISRESWAPLRRALGDV